MSVGWKETRKDGARPLCRHTIASLRANERSNYQSIIIFSIQAMRMQGLGDHQRVRIGCVGLVVPQRATASVDWSVSSWKQRLNLIGRFARMSIPHAPTVCYDTMTDDHDRGCVSSLF